MELPHADSKIESDEIIPRTRGWKMPEEGAEEVSYYELPMNAPEKLKMRIRFCAKHSESLPISRKAEVRD